MVLSPSAFSGIKLLRSSRSGFLLISSSSFSCCSLGAAPHSDREPYGLYLYPAAIFKSTLYIFCFDFPDRTFPDDILANFRFHFSRFSYFVTRVFSSSGLAAITLLLESGSFRGPRNPHTSSSPSLLTLLVPSCSSLLTSGLN